MRRIREQVPSNEVQELSCHGLHCASVGAACEAAQFRRLHGPMQFLQTAAVAKLPQLVRPGPRTLLAARQAAVCTVRPERPHFGCIHYRGCLLGYHCNDVSMPPQEAKQLLLCEVCKGCTRHRKLPVHCPLISYHPNNAAQIATNLASVRCPPSGHRRRGDTAAPADHGRCGPPRPRLQAHAALPMRLPCQYVPAGPS